MVSLMLVLVCGPSDTRVFWCQVLMYSPVAAAAAV